MTKHELEMAKSRVRIVDGQVTVLTDPKIKRCPLRGHLYGCDEESRESVKRVLEGHIEELGMYTSDRILASEEDPVSFGASEMIMNAMHEGLLDAAVTVCEGVGTVIITRPEVLQAVGAHMTGLLATEPIPETRKRLMRRGCLALDKKCTIDQVKGFEMAIRAGHRRVAVTIVGANAREAGKIRDAAKKLKVEVLILAVHNTGVDKAQAQLLAADCDIVWACASKEVRETLAPTALLQIGTGIPVFALTRFGKLMVLNRALQMNDQMLIRRAKLPCLEDDRQPEPLL